MVLSVTYCFDLLLPPFSKSTKHSEASFYIWLSINISVYSFTAVSNQKSQLKFGFIVHSRTLLFEMHFTKHEHVFRNELLRATHSLPLHFGVRSDKIQISLHSSDKQNNKHFVRLSKALTLNIFVFYVSMLESFLLPFSMTLKHAVTTVTYLTIVL